MSDEEEDGKDSLCALCGKEGELYVCEKCPKAYHYECLPIEIDVEAEFFCELGEQHCEQRASKTFEARTVNAVFSIPVTKVGSKKKVIRQFQCVTVEGVEYKLGDYAYMRREAAYEHEVPWIGKITELYRASIAARDKWCTVNFVYMPEDTPLGRLKKHGDKEVFMVHKSIDYPVGDITGKCIVVHESEYQGLKKDPYWKKHWDDVYYYKMHYNETAESFRPAPLPSEERASPAAATAATGRTRKRKAKEDLQLSQPQFDTSFLQADEKEGDMFTRASASLQLSAVPQRLPCREKEHSVITSYLTSTISRRGKSNGLYIAGMPGTGKTATVRQVIRELKVKVKQKQLPDFIYLEINALKLSSADQAYTVLLQELEGQTLNPQKALAVLDKRFDHASSRQKCCVVLLDEMDYIQNRNHSVLYNFFEWPSRRNARLCVVGIANTMNLPETLPPRVQSRLGLQRLTFSAYDRHQLEEIVRDRLTLADCFEPKAIELCARKVSSLSGDVRRALQISRRAIEICQMELLEHKEGKERKQQEGEGEGGEEGGPSTPSSRVTPLQVMRASQELQGEPDRQLLAASSLYEKVFLISLVRLCADEETAEKTKLLSQVITKFQSVLPKLKAPTLTGPSFVEYQSICARLDEAGLIAANRDRFHGDWEVGLALPPEDIHFAYRDDTEVASLLRS